MIYERMADAGRADISRATEKHLEHFAVDGLRTLCVAERELDETLYKVLAGDLSPHEEWTWLVGVA